ncbi:MAG: DUF599 domain-containing protein [Pelagimonas sp.]|uniref:DUF599 domain-containing protein n=1 Tax=Pelagimonas sp. TaxID=2073170 RepID=UPI003D6AD9E1
MGWNTVIDALEPLDLGAVGLFLALWLSLSWLIENPPKNRPSTSKLMSEYRRLWLREFVTRDPRIFDSQIVSSLRQGTAFFASASMIAIGGGFALLGNADRLRGVAQDLTASADPVVVWELKLILMLVMAANAFLKFVWSHRLFGYCSVLMAAVPNDPSDPVAMPRAVKAAEINITAAKAYNRGLRSVYFGIASAAWLGGAIPLLIATFFTLLVIIRREFASHSREVLLNSSDHTPS